MEVSPIGTSSHSSQRTIVVALTTEPASLRALDWVQHNFWKKGDLIHMVHVCTCLSPSLEIFHGVPGTSLHVPDPQPHNESQELTAAREFFRGRVQDKLDKAGISYDMHLFADDSNSDAASIGKLIEQVANKVNAEMVVLARHNKAPSSGFFGPGSVAQYCISLSLPLALVP